MHRNTLAARPTISRCNRVRKGPPPKGHVRTSPRPCTPRVHTSQIVAEDSNVATLQREHALSGAARFQA